MTMCSHAISTSLRASISWLILATPPDQPYSFRIVVHATIWLSGAGQMYCKWHLVSHSFFFKLILFSLKNKEELFNLCHASLWNAIERIFGILKKCFRILLLGVTVWSLDLLFSIIHFAPLATDSLLTFTLATSFFTNVYQYTIQ